MLELAGIVILGILAQWVGWKLKLPAILPLILIGLLFGPISTLYTVDHNKLLEPIWNGKNGLFPGDGLFYFVSLAISIILFEGGLTLKKEEILNVGPVILKLITLAVVITFFGAGFAAHYVIGLSWEISFLFSALIIVTGPTVITPILRNIPLKKDLSAILKWEGILIDPIGALVAVLVFEFISVENQSGFTQTALMEFGKILLFGGTFGFTFAHGLGFAIKKKVIPHYLLNVFTLAAVLGVFVLSDAFAHESGLLAVVVMGLVLGNTNIPNLKELLYFKESLSVLLISILFILLGANINIDDLLLIANWQTVILFVVVVFIVRPVGVFISSIKSGLRLNEKLFISWMGPRGIVAAGIASLFGTRLSAAGEPGAEYITPLVFMIVLGTVLLNATTARVFAKLVGVFQRKSEGILIVGASKVSRLIALYLQKNGRYLVLVDSNQDNIETAKDLGLDAIEANIFNDYLIDNIELSNVGFLMALTGNDAINEKAIVKFKEEFGENGTYRMITEEEMNKEVMTPEQGLFSRTHDFAKLSEVANRYPAISEVPLINKAHLRSIIDITKRDENIVPLFIRVPDGEIQIISSIDVIIDNYIDGSVLAYLGRPIDLEESKTNGGVVPIQA
ncbi:cation:proton antiporter [Aquimarina agarilytica]|uniref:cation:proton antiporter n=1 Tax=Aquimarina agarilytica TaxID=1087449 RepID=UPI00028943F0|nr:sodium:proton antiporter [Aquimarina agarilytica]